MYMNELFVLKMDAEGKKFYGKKIKHTCGRLLVCLKKM